MNWPHKRIWAPLLLAAGGAAFTVVGFRSLQLEARASDRARAAREEAIRRDLRADAMRLMRAPMGRPVAHWRIESPNMVATTGASAPLLEGLRTAAAFQGPARSALAHWAPYLEPGRPAWVRHVAASHAAPLALLAQQADRAHALYELAAEAHPALLDLHQPPVRVRDQALGKLALRGLATGDGAGLRTFLTEAEDGVRLVEGDVLGPGRLILALQADVRLRLQGQESQTSDQPRAEDLDRLERAASFAAQGLHVLRLLPADGACVIDPHWGLRRGGDIWLYPPAALFEGDLGELVSDVRLLPADANDPASLPSNAVVLGAPFERVVLTLVPEGGGNETLIAALVLGLGLLVYAGGAVLVLRGWSRTRLAVAQQTEFVAAVSHELKTPIASVRAMAELMASGGVQDLERTRSYARRIEAEMQRLGGAVRNVLDAAQIERGSPLVHLRPGDPAAVVERVGRMVAPALEQRGYDFSWRAEPARAEMLLDPEALEGVLLNFVDNAAKFSGSGKIIQLEGAPTLGGGYALTVRDRGRGLDPAETARLFQRFYRGQAARAGAAPGVGLGLHIVSGVAAAHGAACIARPREGGGATFGLELRRYA